MIFYIRNDALALWLIFYIRNDDIALWLIFDTRNDVVDEGAFCTCHKVQGLNHAKVIGGVRKVIKP